MMKRIPTWLTVVIGIMTCASLARAETVLPGPLHSAFYPYSGNDGSSLGQTLTPGTTINQHNWHLAEHLLPAEVLSLVQAGDFAIRVQETTDLPVRSSYITATAAHFQDVSLNGGYKIDHYQGGRPFPILDPADPRAGEKAAWNFRYRDVPDTMEMRATMQGVNSDGSTDRSNTGLMRTRYGLYRVGDEKNDRQWEARGVYCKASFEMLSPSDMEGTMRITTYYDNGAHPYDDLSYSPHNRRTRKSYVNMLSRMGGGRYDVLSEEQPPFFFTGYLHEYHWTYKGEPVMLVPGFLQADHLTYGGKNNWYPDVPWELRRVVVLESTPKGSHPYGKRVFYLDAQTYIPFCVLSYDPQGTFVRLTLIVHGNPDFVPGSQGIRLPVPLGATWINFSQNQASQMIAHDPVFDKNFSPRRFELMELLRKGK